jgi:hypothetical protein
VIDVQTYQGHYQEALSRAHRHMLKQYKKREMADPEAARSEAAVYCLFEKLSKQIEINELPFIGGPDFKCSTLAGSFLLEATCLRVASIEKESGIRNGFIGSGSFRPISNKLFQKTMSKVNQLESVADPRVLAITTEHSLGSLLMDIAAAKRLLIGKELITFTINDPDSRTALATELKDSAFYASVDDKNLDHLLQGISAVLLIPIQNNTCHIVCAFNPNSIMPLKEEELPSICAVYIQKEPSIQDNTFSVTVKNTDSWKSISFWP